MTESKLWDSLSEVRRGVLQSEEAWPPIGVDAFADWTGDIPALGERLVEHANVAGVAVVDVRRPLSAEELVELGSSMGLPIREHDEAVQPFCENEYVLNLRTIADSGDIALQPFSHDELFAHTEGSLRPPAQRPRWIVLQCLTASEFEADSQTIAVPMANVARHLTPAQIDTLRHTRRVGSDHYVVTGEPAVFALRDPSVSDDRFDSPEGSGVAEAAVLAAMTAVYDIESVRRIPWRHGVIAVIDNSRVFHARTSGRERGTRHLQRIRVSAAHD